MNILFNKYGEVDINIEEYETAMKQSIEQIFTGSELARDNVAVYLINQDILNGEGLTVETSSKWANILIGYTPLESQTNFKCISDGFYHSEQQNTFAVRDIGMDYVSLIKEVINKFNTRFSIIHNKEVIEREIEAVFKEEQEIQVKALHRDVEKSSNSIADRRRDLSSEITRLNGLKRQLTVMLENPEKIVIMDEINEVLGTKGVEDVEFKNRRLNILTDELFITNKGKQYYVGKVRIEIDFKTNNILIFNNNTSHHKGFRGFWNGGFENCIHPHINGSNGSCCFGNIESLLPDLLGNRQLSALIVLLISYLESCDERDTAGKYIRHFDEVVFNEDGTYTRIPSKIRKCANCGREKIESDLIRAVNNSAEELLFCKSCADAYLHRVKLEDGTEIRATHTYLRNNGDKFGRCERCGGWFHNSNICTVHTLSSNRDGVNFCLFCKDSADDIIEVDGKLMSKTLRDKLKRDEEEKALAEEAKQTVVSEEPIGEEHSSHQPCALCGERATRKNNDDIDMCESCYEEWN